MLGSRRTPCHFYAAGNCRNGSQCAFSHEESPMPSPRNQYEPQNHGLNSQQLSGNGQQSTQPMSNPIIIDLPPGVPVFGIDVECVASGISHNARSVAQVALVDEWCRPVFNAYIKQDLPVVSYITQLTGLTKEIIETHGQQLADALASLRAHIPPSAVLVGQNILKDVQWLQLAEGVDYASLIDISALFRVYNPAHGEYTTFSQDHCAKVWLGAPERSQHNAMEDAAISVSLFNAYRSVQWDPPRLHQLQVATLTTPRIPGFSSRYPVVDNCCMGNRKKCICGAPFL